MIVRTTVAAMAALMVAMSISRFAYTPILPVMIAQHALDHAAGAFLASANLLGYLIGALPAGTGYFRRSRTGWLRWSLVLCVASLALMAVSNPALWVAARFTAGVASAFAFVLASGMVLDLRSALATVCAFASVGAGIAVSGLLVPAAYALAPAWETGWYACAGLAALLSVVTALCAPADAGSTAASPAKAPKRALSLGMLAVFASYGIAGFSYVIPATFLVTLFAAQPSLRPYAAAAWVVVGLTAAASSFAWGPLGERFGKWRALSAALLLMAVACAAPASVRNAGGALAGAIALGGSFMAVSMLTIGLVRDLDPACSSLRIAQATAIFGVGQVLGPLAAGALFRASGSYDAAFFVAAFAQIAAALGMTCVDAFKPNATNVALARCRSASSPLQ